MRYKKEKLGIYGIYHEDICLYIGRGELKDRKSYHWSRCRNQKHKNVELQNYWNEHDGENNFEFREIKYCTMKEYKEFEQYYMDTCLPLFNKKKASQYNYKTNTYQKNKSKEHKSIINSGENNPRAIYTVEDIKRVKRLFADGHNLSDVAKITGINYYYLSSIKNGRKWKSVTIEENYIL